MLFGPLSLSLHPLHHFLRREYIRRTQITLCKALIELNHMLHLLIRINIDGERLLSNKPRNTFRARRRRQRSSIGIHPILRHIIRHLVKVKPPSLSDRTWLRDSGKMRKDLVEQSSTAVGRKFKDLPDDSDGVVG